MAKQIVTVPDIGGAEGVEIIELCVSVGDTVAADDSLIVLESDKASMEVPSPVAGTVVSLTVKEGDKVSEGDAVLELEVEGAQAPAAEPVAEAPAAVAAPAPTAASAEHAVTVPDIGGAEGVEVIEVCVAVGDTVAEGDSIIVLESDKASMEIPAPASGTVVSVSIAEGAKVSEGDAVLVLASASAAPAPVAETTSTPAPAASNTPSELAVAVPDIGGAEGVEVIEVSVAVGDDIAEGDSIIVLESDKASMEIPSPASGKVTAVAIKEGEKVSEGAPVLTLEVVGAAPAAVAPSAPAPKAAAPAPAKPAATPERPQTTNELLPQEIQSSGSEVYAGPAVRKLAREMGVTLTSVKGSGPRNRISKDDVKAYVKSVMLSQKSGAPAAAGGAGMGAPKGASNVIAAPAVDFSKFGEVEKVKLSKIHQITALNMTRNAINVPHVTQFDDADITEMESFRKGMKAQAEKAGVKLTPLPFLLKAAAAALKYEPSFNVSLDVDGEHLYKKDYVHIGVAVATPAGLMVPVIRDVDKKGLFELAEESMALAKKARDGKLKPNEMQGGCFTISSLGGLGGTGFTPIVNTPEVGILGVSKAAVKPVWNGKDFEPRTMLPISLSYDHRAINGADAGNFLTYFNQVLSDIRKLLV